MRAYVRVHSSRACEQKGTGSAARLETSVGCRRDGAVVGTVLHLDLSNTQARTRAHSNTPKVAYKVLPVRDPDFPWGDRAGHVFYPHETRPWVR
jgi:hypothetical protein